MQSLEEVLNVVERLDATATESVGNNVYVGGGAINHLIVEGWVA